MYGSGAPKGVPLLFWMQKKPVRRAPAIAYCMDQTTSVSASGAFFWTLAMPFSQAALVV